MTVYGPETNSTRFLVYLNSEPVNALNFVGATYTADVWSANGRLGHRESDSEQRFALIACWYRDTHWARYVRRARAVRQRQQSHRITNNFNANRRISKNSQLAMQYAFKYVTSDFDGLQFSGYTDLIGIDYRLGFAKHWDAGVHTSIYHSYRSSIYDYGLGLDVGYNVRNNMWITLGYNIAGFHDEDFASARYTAQGPFLRFSIKADQQTLKDIAGQR